MRGINIVDEMRRRGFTTWQFIELERVEAAAAGHPDKEAFAATIRSIDQTRTHAPNDPRSRMNQRGIVEPYDVPYSSEDPRGLLWYLNVSQKHLAGEDLSSAEYPESQPPWFRRLVDSLRRTPRCR